MSSAELDLLEREVEAARAKFAADVGRLRDPRSYRLLKDDLLAEAKQTKDELLDKARSAASEAARDLLNQAKDKAIANPAAAAAIGAGLAWRLFTHPPIASLLVGLGAYSLWRTSPAPNGEGFTGRATDLAETASESTRDWSTRATDRLKEVSEQTTVAAQRASASVQETMRTIRESAKDAATEIASRTSHLADATGTSLSSQVSLVKERATAALHHVPPLEEGVRDNLLLGAAALAVAAAFGIAYRRRSDRPSNPAE
jgi:vacuolar-type H+-ATPase subunit H